MNGLAVSRNSSRSGCGSSPAREDGLPGVEHLLGLLGRGQHGCARLVVAGFLRQPRDRLLQGLQVGQDQLGVDGLHVVGRRHLALDVHHVGVGERPQDLADRVRLAHVGQELVAQTLTLAGAAHDAGDVDERHSGGQDPLGPEDLGQLGQSLIGHRDHPGVRLDRGERVVGRQRPVRVLGQGVEQGGLADVGKADDSDGERCHPLILGPRASDPCRPRVPRDLSDPWGKVSL